MLQLFYENYENVISCVSGITQKTKHSNSITSWWKNSKEQKVLCVIIDNELSIKSHLNDLCKNVFSENCSFYLEHWTPWLTNYVKGHLELYSSGCTEWLLKRFDNTPRKQ